MQTPTPAFEPRESCKHRRLHLAQCLRLQQHAPLCGYDDAEARFVEVIVTSLRSAPPGFIYFKGI